MERVHRLVTILPLAGRRHQPRGRYRIVAVLMVIAAIAGGTYLWFRDSSLVRVETVYVTGVSSSEGPQVRRALTAAAMDMTTLHVRPEDLREAVRTYASVADLRVHADFPDEVTVEVVEREPVAVLSLGGNLVPVGAGGRLMRGVKAEHSLPTVKATRLAPGDLLSDRRALGAVSVLAAAPERLRPRIARAFSGPRGLTLDMRDGPQLIFGSPTDAANKWLAATRVLADPSAVGAVYLDVRIPGRVAAGGLGTVPAEEAVAPAVNPQAAQTNPQP